MTGRRTATLVVLAALLLIVAASEGEAKSGTPITTCGQVVTTDAFLTGDLVCSADGVVVGAAGITIDLKRFTLRGDRSSFHRGVDDSGFGDITVKNGVVRNFEIGVYANGANVRVADLVASGNLEGIVFGMSAASASVTSVTASGNKTFGIRVFGDGGRVTSSIASGNDVGIQVEADSPSIGKSTASGNGTFGIAVYGNGATLKGDQASGNGFASGSSDLLGLGVEVTDFTTPPHGTNTARGNDNSEECDPFYLC